MMNELSLLWAGIREDMRQPVSYLPRGILCGAVAFLILWLGGGLVRYWKRKKYTGNYGGYSRENAAVLPEKVSHGVLKRGLERGGRRAAWKRYVVWFLWTVYVYVLMNTAFFSREPGSRTGVELMLFATWGDSASSRCFVIENILMFLPFGMMLPGLFRAGKKGWVCVLTGLFCSVGIEMLQFVTQRGYCQLDDVVMNTAGAWIGWGIYKILTLFRQYI